MTLEKASEGIFLRNEYTVNIEFINSDDNLDETEFDVENYKELEECWNGFCKENGFDKDAVQHVYKV